MFENRSAIYHNLAGCVVGTAWGAATSLLGSVAVCRLCGVSPELAVVLGNKGISSPFALAGAAALGGIHHVVGATGSVDLLCRGR